MLIFDDIGSGEPILFIHGLGCKRSVWKPQHELASQYRLIIPELRGHGESEINYDITLENFANDMWELADNLKLDRIIVCGHSLGGLVAQGMYRQQPDRVKALILANTYSYFAPGVSDLAYFNRWYNFNVLSAKDYVEKTIDNCLYDKINEELRERARKAFHIRRDNYLDACRAGAYANYRKLLPRITVPTLIISSSEDRVIKPFVHDDMNERIHGSKLITIKRCGHLSNIEKPHEFNEAVRNFMND